MGSMQHVESERSSYAWDYTWQARKHQRACNGQFLETSAFVPAHGDISRHQEDWEMLLWTLKKRKKITDVYICAHTVQYERVKKGKLLKVLLDLKALYSIYIHIGSVLIFPELSDNLDAINVMQRRHVVLQKRKLFSMTLYPSRMKQKLLRASALLWQSLKPVNARETSRKWFRLTAPAMGDTTRIPMIPRPRHCVRGHGWRTESSCSAADERIQAPSCNNSAGRLRWTSLKTGD